MSISGFNSICLIGKAETQYKRGEILRINSIEKAKTLYGENCELYKIFSKISNYDTIELYTINIWTTEDYIKSINTLKQYDISYICPIEIYIDEIIWYKNVRIPKLKLLLENLNTKSSVIATYHHADKFLSLDDFINKSELALEDFQKSCYDFIRRRGDNLLFCLNNLKDYQSANAIVASALLNSTLGTYPNADIGNVVYTMHSSDIYTKSIYFRSNHNILNTIENLVNHTKGSSSFKYEEINIVKKYIEWSIQHCGLKGKKFDLKMVRDTIFKVMKNIKDHHYIKDFYVNSIDYVTTNSVDILTDITIIPVSTFESYRVRLEV